jgi:oligoribonuclease
VHQDDAALAEMDDVVVEMHTKSGLLDAIRSSTMSLADAGAQTLEFIKQHVTEARRVPLCGNSIGMDRRFLAAYLPEIEEYLHYRSVDVSTVKELVKRWYPALNSGRPRKAGSHRAMDDVIESVAEMKFYREHVFVHEVPASVVAAVAAEPEAPPDAPDFPEPTPTEHSPESS